MFVVSQKVWKGGDFYFLTSRSWFPVLESSYLRPARPAIFLFTSAKNSKIPALESPGYLLCFLLFLHFSTDPLNVLETSFTETFWRPKLTFEFSGSRGEIRPSKLTNGSARTNWDARNGSIDDQSSSNCQRYLFQFTVNVFPHFENPASVGPVMIYGNGVFLWKGKISQYQDFQATSKGTISISHFPYSNLVVSPPAWTKKLPHENLASNGMTRVKGPSSFALTTSEGQNCGKLQPYCLTWQRKKTAY